MIIAISSSSVPFFCSAFFSCFLSCFVVLASLRRAAPRWPFVALSVVGSSRMARRQSVRCVLPSHLEKPDDKSSKCFHPPARPPTTATQAGAVRQREERILAQLETTRGEYY